MLSRVLVACLLVGSAATGASPAAQATPSEATREPAPPQPDPQNPPAREPSAPAATPSAPAASTDADPLTPKGSLKLLASALRDGNADAIRQVMHAANPSEVRMVAAMAEMAKAMASLQKAAVK